MFSNIVDNITENNSMSKEHYGKRYKLCENAISKVHMVSENINTYIYEQCKVRMNSENTNIHIYEQSNYFAKTHMQCYKKCPFNNEIKLVICMYNGIFLQRPIGSHAKGKHIWCSNVHAIMK